MILTIDNLDGAGARDHTAYIDAEHPPKLRRRLNRPAEFEAALVLYGGGTVVPVDGGRVVFSRNGGSKLFTGYLTEAPEYEYLGWGEAGPGFRYRLRARSDEAALDRKRLPQRAPLIARTAGGALKQLAADAGSTMSVTAVQDGATLPSFSISPERPWSDHASDLGLRSRFAYRAHDGALSFTAPGVATHAISESDESFSPDFLKLRSAAGKLLNDVTVVGRTEPREHVKNYFIGDGIRLEFNLSHTPFTRRARTFVEEEFRGSVLDALRWTKQDPGSAISLSGGKLLVNGGTGSDGQTTVAFVELMELGGALTLNHGEVNFTGASDGIIGGLYSGSVTSANCFAGFRCTPNGSQATIRAFINGVNQATTINTVAGRRYALTTRIYATEPYRSQQVFHSSTRPASNPRGGAAIASNARMILEVHEIDPANPATLQTPSTILYDQVISAPGFCTHALVNSVNMVCNIAFTRMVRAIECEVRTTAPSQSPRTRLVGTIAEGCECLIGQNNELQFFSQFVPAPNETIVVRYRNRGRSIARVLDAASIADHVRPGDDGVRSGIRRFNQPAPRVSADCENAAAALLDDSTQLAWAGSYECWSPYLPNGAASDPLPGDTVTVNVPSRAANFSAIIREVVCEAVDLSEDILRYRLAFANEAFAPLALETDDAISREELEAVTPGTGYIADLPNAEVTSITSTTVVVDAGAAPPSGGGFEVRRTDFGWGAENDRNLIGRFTTQSFAVPRLARVQTYHLRPFDGATPRKYSRYSTVLHVDYPF